MSFKPNDFFFNIVDFLAFLVPGMILLMTIPKILCGTFSLCPTYLEHFQLNENLKFPSENLLIFFLLSFIFGHFIHHIGAMIFNPLYSKIYFIRKVRKHKNFIYETEKYIKVIIPEHTDMVRVADAYIRKNQQSLIPELDKHEANSKLFRGLSILCLYLCLYPEITHWHILILIILSILSFTRFANQRWRKQLLTYELFSILIHKET